MHSLPDYCQLIKVTDSKGKQKEIILPKSLDIYRPKRHRTSFTKFQLTALEAEFRCNPYLVGQQRLSAAERLNLTDAQIKVWFQNRRTKVKKHLHSKDEYIMASGYSVRQNMQCHDQQLSHDPENMSMQDMPKQSQIYLPLYDYYCFLNNTSPYTSMHNANQS